MSTLKENNKVYFIKDDKKYLISHPEHGAEVPGRQLAQIARGDYGELVQEIYEAQEVENLPHRFAYQGIINSLGDFAQVLPPTAPVK